MEDRIEPALTPEEWKTGAIAIGGDIKPSILAPRDE